MGLKKAVKTLLRLYRDWLRGEAGPQCSAEPSEDKKRSESKQCEETRIGIK